MKKAQANPAAANQAVVKFVKNSKRKTVIVLSVVLVIALALGIGTWAIFYQGNDSQKATLTDSQKRTKDTITAQEQVIQEQKGGSDAAQAAMYGNLAQSYAYTGECDKAHEMFGKAKALAPAGSQDGLQRTEDYIKGYCP